ncbi:hypothetical protein BP6252_08818 [Coleophoma cylindrospora]|uniref:Uncharacterized protein n=1 Tax=Coleophoma cylindrospora TaxID=1849047 RepID=A0A3D8R790_9HELO|nr:hypothetical protein BP6252_08818 [Coleophoma cylindrospora]
MSPSRGVSGQDPSQLSSDEATTEAKANVKSSSALTSAKQNITYLLSPNNPNSPHPAKLRTRALLKSLHYLSVFIFWRVVRYAKYAVVGSIVAAVGATAFGGFVSGVGWVLAPPGILGTVAVGTAWAIGKWGFRKLGVKERTAVEVQRQGKRDAQGVRADGQWRDVQGPRAVPW